MSDFGKSFDKAAGTKNDPYNLRAMTLVQLADWIGIQKKDSASHILGMNELKRRNEKTSRLISIWAFVISVVSLIVSGLKLVCEE